MPIYSAIVAGIGGQGVITLGAYLKKAALHAGIHVSGSERRGGAQREGHVSSMIRYRWTQQDEKPDVRRNVASPLIPAGCAHLLIGLEPLEALRASRYLNEQSVAIVNLAPLIPVSVRLGETDYPEPKKIREMLATFTTHLYALDLSDIARRAFGHVHAINGLSLGIAARVGRLPVSEGDLLHVLQHEARPEDLESFRLGVELVNERK